MLQCCGVLTSSLTTSSGGRSWKLSTLASLSVLTRSSTYSTLQISVRSIAGCRFQQLSRNRGVAPSTEHRSKYNALTHSKQRTAQPLLPKHYLSNTCGDANECRDFCRSAEQHTNTTSQVHQQLTIQHVVTSQICGGTFTLRADTLLFNEARSGQSATAP